MDIFTGVNGKVSKWSFDPNSGFFKQDRKMIPNHNDQKLPDNQDDLRTLWNNIKT